MTPKKILLSIAAVLFGLLAVNCVIWLAITIYFKRAFAPELAALVCLIAFFQDWLNTLGVWPEQDRA